MENIICKKEIDLNGKTFIAYLKEVPFRLDVGGEPRITIERAFIRRK